MAFAECGNVTQAAKIAAIPRTMHYDWLQKDARYAAAFADAQEQAADHLEQEARRRAVQGTREPIYYQGERVGFVRRYSDTLLIFLLKGARPEKYREVVKNVHTGEDGKPIEHRDVTRNILSNLTPEQLDQLLALAEAVHHPGGESAPAAG